LARARSPGTTAGPRPYVLVNQAFTLQELGRYREAIAAADRALETIDRTTGVRFTIHALITKIGALAGLGDLVPK
jgi:hypothetical protein